MRPLSRRTMLRGASALLALPLLEAMGPRSLFAAPEVAAPRRMAYIFFPNGAIMPHWKPTAEGTNFPLPKTLQPLEPVRDQLMVISGLAQDNARAKADGAGDHARSASTFLTCAHARKTDGADIFVGTSVDQVAAEKIGSQTKLPSMELGIESGRQAGSCDSGYSCAYSNSISWKTASTPMGKEVNPKLAFERLFGGEDLAKAAERDFYRKSILDTVAGDAQRLQKDLGVSDKRKLDEYFSSVREIEQRISRASTDNQKRTPTISAPAGIPEKLSEHIDLMFDLMQVAFQTDSTRVITLMLANEGSNRAYREVDVKEGHHQLSHHRDEQEKVAQLQKIDQYLVERFGRFLKKLQETREGNTTLLDQSMIVYGCSISDGNRHRHEDLPVLLAGRGGGTITSGRHLSLKSEVPIANLYLAMLDRMGAKVDRFGDSTGVLKEIA